MPELPEVEVIARRLQSGSKAEPAIVSHAVAAVQVPSKKALKEPASAAAFRKAIVGARFTGVRRRAKHLLLETDRGTLLVHLRLTGDLHVHPPGADEPRFLRVGLVLDDGRLLAFTDGRHLGEVRFVKDARAVEKKLGKLGPEPLDASFDVDALAAVLSSSKRAVKAVLLDQEAVAGVGNIYSDEACFRAKIHPATPASSLTRKQVAALHEGIVAALGSSIDELVAADLAIDWRYADRSAVSPFLVYDRAGEPCTRCGTKLKSSTIGGRTSVWCPRCQKR